MSKGKQSLTPTQNARLAAVLEELKKQHGTGAAVGELLGGRLLANLTKP